MHARVPRVVFAVAYPIFCLAALPASAAGEEVKFSDLREGHRREILPRAGGNSRRWTKGSSKN
jgi:hypothetical protein